MASAPPNEWPSHHKKVQLLIIGRNQGLEVSQAANGASVPPEEGPGQHSQLLGRN